jgi:[acyl-carrier-protein] S-malonyltransferase
VTGLALLFPGQGSQRPGMCASLRDTDPELLSLHLGRAQDASGLPIGRLAADGPDEALMRTDIVQAGLHAVSLALFDVARAVGLRPAAMAGHSLGEYTAAVAARVLSAEEGAALVAERGRLMARANAGRPGAMAAILGPTPDAVDALCARAAEGGTLQAANFNTPTQTVVSGDEAAVRRLLALVDGRPMMRAMLVPAGGAFHSALMRPVQGRLGEFVATLNWRDPDVPVASNAFGTLVRSASDVCDSLLAQVTSPVRWVDCVRALMDAGCEHFLELGPGRILRGLVRQIARQVDVAAADSRPAIEAYLASRPHLLAS